MTHRLIHLLQVRSGNVIDLDGRLCEVLKLVHTQGHGRQLGNVQVIVSQTLQAAQIELLHLYSVRLSGIFIHATPHIVILRGECR